MKVIVSFMVCCVPTLNLLYYAVPYSHSRSHVHFFIVLPPTHSFSIQGRPFPLKGRFYANIFIHFEPTGHSLRHNANIEMEDPTAKYRKAIQDRHGGHENNHEGLPPYILEDSEEGRLWHQNHPDNQRVSRHHTLNGWIEIFFKL
jgi:hypothetical protein